MSIEKPSEWRPLVPLLLLHAAAAVSFFAVFTVALMRGFFTVLPMEEGDVGGPLVLPIILVGLTIVGAIITAFLAGAVLVSDLLRRRVHLPLWVPPLAVFLWTAVAALVCLLGLGMEPILSPVVGGAMTILFMLYWAGHSIAWSLLRKLSVGEKLFTPKGL